MWNVVILWHCGSKLDDGVRWRIFHIILVAKIIQASLKFLKYQT